MATEPGIKHFKTVYNQIATRKGKKTKGMSLIFFEYLRRRRANGEKLLRELGSNENPDPFLFSACRSIF